MKGVRWRDGSGFEGQCDYCREYLPLEYDFWYPRGGLRRCRACWREYHRLHEQGRRGDEIIHELTKAKARADYYAHRDQRLTANRAWKEANKVRVKEYQRKWREQNREKSRAASKAYYDEAREVILAKKRAAYRGEKAA